MAAEDIFIGRQPILDARGEMFAYELLFRSGTKSNAAVVTDDMSATASVISNAFMNLGIEQSLGPYKGFINCDEHILLSDLLEALPADKIVLEVLETVEVTPEIVERCAELKARGFTVALDDFVSDTGKWKPILELVDIVKVDLMPLSLQELDASTQSLRQFGLQMLAEKVDSREQSDHCLNLGYHLFQGYYFAKPVIITGRKLGQSQLALMQLLGMVLDDAETTHLEAVFKREPGLALNLMRLTNSAASGLRTKVTSLRHAISVLGRQQLQRWLQLLLYTNPSGGTGASPLMQMAATRGRLMELLAGKLSGAGKDLADKAFMTGIMSLMPTLMGAPLEEILKGINLANEIVLAMEKGEGSLGKLLRLCESVESADAIACQLLCHQLPGIDAPTLNACQVQALAWASNIGRENPDN